MEHVEQVELVEPKAPVKMVAPKKAKAIKIKALRDIYVNGQIFKAGAEIECSEEDAKEFCTPISGPYNFSGHRNDNDAPFAQLFRAERIN
jgi:hypothetical protein